MRVFNLNTVDGQPDVLHPVMRMKRLVRAWKVGPQQYQHFHLLVLCSDNRIYAMPVKCVEKIDTGISFACTEVALTDSLLKKVWIVDDRGKLLKEIDFDRPWPVEVGKNVNITLGIDFPPC